MRGRIKDKVYIKFEDENGKLKLYGGSWTINLDEIGNKSIETVIFKTPEEEYTIPFKNAINVGRKMTFKGENKLVVPIRYWSKTSKTINRVGLFN